MDEVFQLTNFLKEMLYGQVVRLWELFSQTKGQTDKR